MASVTQSISQASVSPTTKVAAGGVAGAATVMLVYVLGLFHLPVTPEVGSAATVIFTFVTSYLMKDRGVAVADSANAPAG